MVSARKALFQPLLLLLASATDKEVEVKRVGPRSPNLNAYAERWVQTARQECLDRFVVFGEGRLRHLLREYVAHYNEERPHQRRDNLLLGGAGPDPGGGEVVCRERLGGLLKHYGRRAA
jgi:putative transposase